MREENIPNSNKTKSHPYVIVVIRCSLQYALAHLILVIPKWRMAETLKTKALISVKPIKAVSKQPKWNSHPPLATKRLFVCLESFAKVVKWQTKNI